MSVDDKKILPTRKSISGPSSPIETSVKELKFHMDDDMYEDVVIPLREWYLDGNVYKGKQLSPRQMCSKLNIKRDMFEAVLAEVKAMALLDVSDQGRARFFQELISTINLDLVTLNTKLEKVLYPLLAAVESIDEDEYKEFFSSENGAMLMASVSKLLSQKESLISRKMDIAKLVFGTASGNNPIYERLNDISGVTEIMTKQDVIEHLDNARQLLGTPSKTGQLNISYDEYIKLREAGGEIDETE